ncbi:PQQ-dependent sugar dehydrogenase [Ornithinibacillus xuwenensis]|uniref:PQQ-dependent sugar dehydrogenase n=1 Tax=Ornithinibacillus xuwenensis TaxID=3144668 RepID=A0ABU9XP15_9BACI
MLISCSDQKQEVPNPSSTVINQSDKKVEIIATNLQEPWEIARQGDTFYISERDGSIVEIVDGNKQRKPVNLKKDLSNQPEAGLLGIALPADFTNTAYAYYSYVEDDTYYQRVVEIRLVDGGWEESNVLLDKIPGGQYHQGGRIEIGPDEKLYITTGDATVPELAQEVDSLAGKILRMNLDGSIPTDNPFRNSYVYSYGHRNPQGIAWDSSGNMYATEHGSSAHDEINQIEKGSNYGWPIIQGSQIQKGMEPPIIHSGETTWAPSGMAFLHDRFYFASLRGEGLRMFDPNTKEQALVLANVGRVRDVFATPEGLYLITNNTDGRGNPSRNDDVLLFIPIDQLELSSS